MKDTRLFCYRLNLGVDYDEEQVWAYVQRSGGHLSIQGGYIDFWIPPEAQVLLLCAWPELERCRSLDYI